jgi:large subunit ribosomal protein L31
MSSADKVTLDDGNSYPRVKLEISSASHPFFTGKKTVVDTQGRVEKFKSRYQTAVKKKKK